MYQFNLKTIEPFDIILVRFAEDRLSKIIRKKCNSDFSHAIVYIGNDSFMEGVEPVVTLFSPQRYFFPNLENVKVLRLNDDMKAKFNVEAAEDFIRTLSFCNYSNAILNQILNKNIPTKQTNIFAEQMKWVDGVVCTTMVSLPYYIGGIDLSQTNEPYYVHFNHIENYPFFTDVTANVLQEVASVDQASTFDYFLCTSTGSILEKQRDAVETLNALVETIYKELQSNPQADVEFGIRIDDETMEFISWESVFANIIRWSQTDKGKEIDIKISNAIASTEYNILWQEEMANNPLLFYPLKFYGKEIAGYSLNREPEEYFVYTRQSLEVTMLRMAARYRDMMIYYLSCKSETFKLLVTMYRGWFYSLQSTIKEYDEIIQSYKGS